MIPYPRIILIVSAKVSSSYLDNISDVLIYKDLILQKIRKNDVFCVIHGRQ